MILYLLCLVPVLTAQAPPGPRDAFQANQASARARGNFQFTWHVGDSPLHGSRSRPFEPGQIITAPARFRAEGYWESDGDGQHTKIERSEPLAGGETARVVPRLEVLANSELMAHRIEVTGSEPLQIQPAESLAASSLPLVGPFHWFHQPLIAGILAVDFGGVSPDRSPSDWGGPTETEVYRNEFPGGWYQAEISYDPRIGYLPRHIRLISKGADDTATIKEAFIQEARPCGAGGFIPTEWCEASFQIPRFSRSHAEYTDRTRLVPVGDVAIGHFVMGELEANRRPLALSDEARNHGIVTPSGTLRDTSIKGPLDLKALKRAMSAPTIATGKLPKLNIDEVERAEFTQPRRRFSNLSAGLVCLAVALGIVVVILRRKAILMLIVVVGIAQTAMTGCSQPADEPPNLVVGFVQPLIVHDAYSGALDTTLRLTNAGAQAIRVYKVDGGCSCRRVDPSRFPLALDAAESAVVPISIDARRRYDPQPIVFEIATDRGPIARRAILRAMPRRHISPDSLTVYAVEGEDSPSVELTHREVFSKENGPPGVEIVAPRGFTLVRLSSCREPIADAEPLVFEDVRYSLRLHDSSIGTFREGLVLRGAAGERPLEVPIVWRRIAYLSSIPERVVLGPSPARVFLRCPDESVELKEVLSIPSGLNVIISSPRELSISLRGDAPGIVDGVIEVATTAADRPPLRVPVVRYAPEQPRPSNGAGKPH